MYRQFKDAPNEEEKIQNEDKGMELRLSFKEGLTLEIEGLSLTGSSGF